jgi:hypothetical protein
VLITVYDMLECYEMDIFAWSSLGTGGGVDEAEMNAARRLLGDVEEPVGWCIFAVDVRNTYGLPFEVSFERVQKGRVLPCASPPAASSYSLMLDTPLVECVSIVPPGSTSRFVICAALLDKAEMTRQQSIVAFA